MFNNVSQLQILFIYRYGFIKEVMMKYKVSYGDINK